MKKIFMSALCLCTLIILSGCCSNSCAETSPVNGSWQMYGVAEDGKLTEAPVIMTFSNDGNITTVIEGKDVRKSKWKLDGKYIIILQEGEPTVRMQWNGKDRIEFVWKGGKYQKKGLKLVLQKK